MGPSSIFPLDNPRLMTAWMASHECLCSTHSCGASLILQAAKTKALFWVFRLGCVFMLQLYIASDQTQGVEQVGNAKSACQRARVGRQSCAMKDVISCSLPTSTPFTISRSRAGSTAVSVLQHGSGKQDGPLTGFLLVDIKHGKLVGQDKFQAQKSPQFSSKGAPFLLPGKREIGHSHQQ